MTDGTIGAARPMQPRTLFERMAQSMRQIEEPMPSPFDICACGHDREEHDANGCREYHAPTRCTAFRLSCTAAEMQESMDAWSAECQRRGV